MTVAIIRSGGKQFRVEKGAKIRVPALKHDIGAAVELEVLATAGKTTKVGAPLVEGSKVTATIVDHGRAPKSGIYNPADRIDRIEGIADCQFPIGNRK